MAKVYLRTGLIPLNGGRVGQNTSDSAALNKPWYKFASVNMGKDKSYKLTCLVQGGLEGTNVKQAGIFSVGIRTGSDFATRGVTFTWLSRSQSISPADFVICHKYTSGSSAVAELYCKIPTAWYSYNFEALHESVSTTRSQCWTFYNANTAGQSASLPSGYTQLISSDHSVAGVHPTQRGSIYINGSSSYTRTPFKPTNIFCYPNSTGLGIIVSGSSSRIGVISDALAIVDAAAKGQPSSITGPDANGNYTINFTGENGKYVYYTMIG